MKPSQSVPDTYLLRSPTKWTTCPPSGFRSPLCPRNRLPVQYSRDEITSSSCLATSESTSPSRRGLRMPPRPLRRRDGLDDQPPPCSFVELRGGAGKRLGHQRAKAGLVQCRHIAQPDVANLFAAALEQPLWVRHLRPLQEEQSQP